MNIRRKKPRSLFSRIAPWALLALVVIFVGGFIAFRIWFFGYLKSDAFRTLIGGLTSKQIKANGEYLPFSFNDSAIYSDGFKAGGGDAAWFNTLRADQLRAQINLGGLWRHAWQIDEITIQRLQVVAGHGGMGGSQTSTTDTTLPDEDVVTANSSPSPWAQWLPNRVDLRKVIIHDTDLKWGENTPGAGGINNAEFIVTPDDDAWVIRCDSGTLSQQGQPNLAISQADLRYQHSILYITNADLRYNADSSIDLSGQIDFGKDFNVQAKLNSVPVTPLLRPNWQAKLKGDLSGTVKVSATLPIPAGSSPYAEGNLSLAHGEIEALPVLDEIATFTRTERFRRFSLSRVTANFTRSDSRLKVTNFIAESDGLIRVDGSFEIVNGQIDGTFQVGVTPSSLEWLPAAMQNQVFTASHDGYVWTTMHLTGPTDHPSEDLSSRLIAATPGAIIETAKGVIDNVPGASTVTGEGKKILDTVLSPLTGQ